MGLIKFNKQNVFYNKNLAKILLQYICQNQTKHKPKKRNKPKRERVLRQIIVNVLHFLSLYDILYLLFRESGTLEEKHSDKYPL